MRIIARKTLVEYWTANPRSEEQLKAWYAEADSASWTAPADVKAKYGSASILKDGRVVFNICGNEFRFIGTHPEYDEIDAQTI